MGKKMGINSKAVEARERKDAQKKAKNEAVERRREDEFWKDEDKHINRKIDRQKEREQKAQEERARKAALKAEYEKEMEAAEQSAKSKAARAAAELPKLTRISIQTKLEDTSKTITPVSKQMSKVNTAPTPLVPNLNRLEEDAESATTVDQALEVLKVTAVIKNPVTPVQTARKH